MFNKVKIKLIEWAKVLWQYCTPLGLFNILIAQWFCFRVFRKARTVVKPYTTGYGIMFPVAPLTGWWSDYSPKKQYRCMIWGE